MNFTTTNINTSWTKPPFWFGLLLVIQFMVPSGCHVCVPHSLFVCVNRQLFLPALVPAPVVRSAPMRPPERSKSEEIKRKKSIIVQTRRETSTMPPSLTSVTFQRTQFNHRFTVHVRVCVSALHVCTDTRSSAASYSKHEHDEHWTVWVDLLYRRPRKMTHYYF